MSIIATRKFRDLNGNTITATVNTEGELLIFANMYAVSYQPSDIRNRNYQGACGVDGVELQDIGLFDVWIFYNYCTEEIEDEDDEDLAADETEDVMTIEKEVLALIFNWAEKNVKA